jgi:hypothetical protein
MADMATVTNPSINQRIVTTIRVVPHTIGGWPNPPMSDTHWSIYFPLEDPL